MLDNSGKHSLRARNGLCSHVIINKDSNAFLKSTSENWRRVKYNHCKPIVSQLTTMEV